MTDTTFAYTGASQDWVVPAGVSTITVDAYGAAGGDEYAAGNTATRGGGRVKCDLAVTPGETLRVFVGGAGARGANPNAGPVPGGFNGGGASDGGGGGGGGATDIRRAPYGLAHRLVVAGGGGGNGGNNGETGLSGGGGGSTPTGIAGQPGAGTGGGNGGSASAGGSAGAGSTANGTAGTLGLGGDGGVDHGIRGGGGGGGGLYGGGGGGTAGAGSRGGGGGGGSGLSTGVNETLTPDVKTGDGLLTLTYDTTPTAPTTTAAHLRVHPSAASVAGAATTQTVLVAPALRSPVAYGPLIGSDDFVAPIVAHVLHRNAPTTVVATLDEAHSIRWLDQLNEAGSGSVVLQNDDPALALIEDGDLIRLEHYGYAAMCLLAQDFTKVALAEGEEHDQTTTITGPGHLALLESARVYPARGVGSLPAEEDRFFSWFSPDFDASSWGYAAEMVTQGDTDGSRNPWWAGRPENWPDQGAPWIWDPRGNAHDAPVGLVLARHDFDAPTDCRIMVFVTVDDYGQLYVDGQLMVEEIHDWQRTYTVELDVSAGPHTLAIYGENTVHIVGENPGGILCAVYVRNADGSLGDRLDVTSGDWRILGYPPAIPGMSPTEVIRHVVDEAQARGELTGITLMFSDETDSDGEAVPNVADIATKTGTDCLTFIRELAATYLDVWMAPGGLELWAWNRDGRGRDSGVAFEAGVNLVALTQRRLAGPTNALLVRWHGGWHEVTAPASIAAHGRQGGLLGLGAARSIGEVERITAQQFVTYADPRQSLTVDLDPAGEADRPYPGFLVADRVTVPVDGTPTGERVVALTVAQDDNGQVTYTPELHDVILGAQERLDQAIKKMSDGTMRGTTVVATPVSQVTGPGAPDCCPPQPPAGSE